MGRPACDVHGDRATYIGGCRCGDCREANAAYQRRYRQGLAGSYSRRQGGYRIAAARHADDATPATSSIWGRRTEPDE